MVPHILIFALCLLPKCLLFEVSLFRDPLEEINNNIIQPFEKIGNSFGKTLDRIEEGFLKKGPEKDLQKCNYNDCKNDHTANSDEKNKGSTTTERQGEIQKISNRAKRDTLLGTGLDNPVSENPLKGVKSVIEDVHSLSKNYFRNAWSTVKDTVIDEPLETIKDTVDQVNPIPSVVDDAFTDLNALPDIIGCTKINETVINFLVNSLIFYEKSNIEMPFLQETLQHLHIPKHCLRRKIVNPVVKAGICVTFAAAFKYFILRSRLNFSRARLVSVLVFFCTTLKIESKRTCRGFIELNIDTLIKIAKENRKLNEYKMSSIILQNFGCFKSYRAKWSVELPAGESPNRLSKSSSRDFYRILQITDIHMDPLYKVGVTTNCDEPLCCQNDQMLATDSTNSAGKWGDYRTCDMPYEALDNLIDQLLKHNRRLNPKFSYIYFTGDIISHRIWDTSKKMNTREIKRVYQLFKEKFGSIAQYPILGNHEPHPLNLFSPLSVTNNNLSTTWIFDLIAEEWSVWLPNEALTTIRQGGYYTVLVKRGFRIIALNSNVCYTYNWWLLFNETDPFGQLQWLVGVLNEAEKNNESVHILSHVPPGDATCLQEWSRQYGRIVKRFANTITGQFNGHTHLDEFRAFFKNKTQVVSVAYNGGSFTSYSNLNPNYRFYDVDSESHELLDYEEWTFNLEKANKNPNVPPKWYKLYNFAAAYNVKSLRPRDIQGLLIRMKSDAALLGEYRRFKVRDAKPSMSQSCDQSCNLENLCTIVSTEADEAADCSTSISIIPS